jgi:single-stranded DNA-binding protein
MAIEAAFLGTLGKDAELKTSKGGKAYLRLNVRIGDGQTAQWVAVTTFDEDATAMPGGFIKGAAVYVEGKLTLDRWTATSGEKRAGLSVLSRHCRLAAIGRNKTKPRRPIAATSPSNTAAPTGAGAHADFNDELPGWTP